MSTSHCLQGKAGDVEEDPGLSIVDTIDQQLLPTIILSVPDICLQMRKQMKYPVVLPESVKKLKTGHMPLTLCLSYNNYNTNNNERPLYHAMWAQEPGKLIRRTEQCHVEHSIHHNFGHVKIFDFVSTPDQHYFSFFIFFVKLYADSQLKIQSESWYKHGCTLLSWKYYANHYLLINIYV